VLFNHAGSALKFQRAWLMRHTVERVINLCDLRFLLFEKAIKPALVVQYSAPASDGQGHIEYLAPKADINVLKTELLTIQAEDRTRIDTARMVRGLKAGVPPLVWKERLWGTPRDWRFLDRLMCFPSLRTLVGSAHRDENKRWVIGQGFKPEKGDVQRKESKERPWPNEKLFLEGRSKAIDLLLLESDCTKLGMRFPWLHRVPNNGAEVLFDAPHVLVSKGLKVAYADFDVVFRHAIQGIHGPSGDRALLLFLTACLSSSLAKYFLFHTTASWGIERPEVHLAELLRFPFPLPEQLSDPKTASGIIETTAGCFDAAIKELKDKSLGRSVILAKLRKEIDQLVFQYYDIDDHEQLLIEDTLLISEPSATPTHRDAKIPTLEPTDEKLMQSYVALLCNVLNEWTVGSNYRVVGDGRIMPDDGLACAVLRRVSATDEATRTAPTSSAVETALTRLFQSGVQQRGVLTMARALKIFIGDEVWIIKPLATRFWTNSAALNDADELATAIMMARHRGTA